MSLQAAQVRRISMNDPWGELSRLAFDELCPGS
jgi:hypothetical protein